MSNINPNNIDGTFPIAGQDNSSQGFRDNFTNIRNNFSYAQSEMSDLQAKAITTSALTGQSLVNDMNYNQIMYAQLFSPSYTFLNIGTPTGGTTVTLDYSQANFQKFTTNGNYSIGFTGWPTSGQMSEMTLWVNVTSTSHVLTFSLTSPGVTIGFTDIAGANTTNGTMTFDQVGNYFLRFRTVDAGQNIIISDVGRNYASLRDPNLYWNDTVTPTLLIGYGQNQTEFQTILALESGQDTVSARGSYNAVGVGTLSLANISSPYFDTGTMAGYTISGTRGNLQTGTISAVSNNDFLGYVNAVTMTGSPTEVNSLQQVAAIGFFATGSNAIGGLGGNVGIYTHQPVTAGNLLVQAAGFENDQSSHFYGNVFVSAATQNTGASTGALQVTGGASIGANLYVGGNLTLAGNVSSLTLTSALRFANLTTTQVASISSPAPGMTVYNFTTGNIQVYNGTKWANVTLS